jgi:hypothetical protein
MAGVSFSMRAHYREQPAIRSVVSAMTSPLVEQHEAFLTQQCLHFPKANAVGRTPHPVEESLSTGHSISGT